MAEQEESKYCGVVRKIMDDGRLSIPAEYWRRIGVNKSDRVQILLTAKYEMIICPSWDKRRGYIGIDRVIGSNGQVCIPSEYRQTLSITTNNQVEILLTQKNEIIIKPYINL